MQTIDYYKATDSNKNIYIIAAISTKQLPNISKC